MIITIDNQRSTVFNLMPELTLDIFEHICITSW